MTAAAMHGGPARSGRQADGGGHRPAATTASAQDGWNDCPPTVGGRGGSGGTRAVLAAWPPVVPSIAAFRRGCVRAAVRARLVAVAATRERRASQRYGRPLRAARGPCCGRGLAREMADRAAGTG